MIPLFEGEGQDNNLPDRISKYLDFSVHMKKGLPCSVCVECTSNLLNWHRFYKNCEKVNDHFREMLLTPSNSKMLLPIIVRAPLTETESIEEDDDEEEADGVGIDFDEDSSAFNKILNDADLDQAVAQGGIIITDSFTIAKEEAEEDEQLVAVEEDDEMEEDKEENEQVEIIEQAPESNLRTRTAGRRKLPR